MGWLLELLIEGIQEKCSQFIIDMMEVITQMFTELLSCDLNLFESLFGVVGSLYKNVIVPLAIALLLLICVWQLFKSMFGRVGLSSEDPIELLGRSCACLFMIVGSRSLINYILYIAGTPYKWIVGTDIEVNSFSEYVSSLEGVTAVLGIDTISMLILTLIMQLVVAWNYFKMLFIVAERYVLLGVFTYTAPLAFATGGSKATNNVLASWAKMFGGQVVLIILNAWSMKMFLSAYGNMLASGYGFTKFFAATLCLIGFCKITFKLDTYMASLGVNLGRPSNGMGAMGIFMAANRIFSSLKHLGTSDTSGEPTTGGSGGSAGTNANMYNMSGYPTDPIPINSQSSMNAGSEAEEHESGAETSTGANSTFDIPPYEMESDNVLEALGEMPDDERNDAGSTGDTVENTMETGVVYTGMTNPTVGRRSFDESSDRLQGQVFGSAERSIDDSRDDVAGMKEAIYSGEQVIPISDVAQQDGQGEMYAEQDPLKDEFGMSKNAGTLESVESGADAEAMGGFNRDNNATLLETARSDAAASTIGDYPARKDDDMERQEELDMDIGGVILEDTGILDSTTGSTSSAYDGSVTSLNGVSSGKMSQRISDSEIINEIGAEEFAEGVEDGAIILNNENGMNMMSDGYNSVAGTSENGQMEGNIPSGKDDFMGGHAKKEFPVREEITAMKLHMSQQNTGLLSSERSKPFMDPDFHPVPESLTDENKFMTVKQGDVQPERINSQSGDMLSDVTVPKTTIPMYASEASAGIDNRDVRQQNDHSNRMVNKNGQRFVAGMEQNIEEFTDQIEELDDAWRGQMTDVPFSIGKLPNSSGNKMEDDGSEFQI